VIAAVSLGEGTHARAHTSRSMFNIDHWLNEKLNPGNKNMITDDDDIILQDADADDYYIMMTTTEEKDQTIIDNASSMNTNMNMNTNTAEEHKWIPRWSRKYDESTIHQINWNCTWFTLSHYVEPDTDLYDGIEGFLIAVLFCLVTATLYNYFYYCCFVRCGCCPDDRVYTSALNKKGRRRRRKARPPKRQRMSRGRNTGGGCCKQMCRSGCFCWPSSCCCPFGGKEDDEYDNKGVFTLITADTHSVTSSLHDDLNGDHSDLSLDSALSLEYGDDHLHNEYGEVTSRWEDEKIESAAKAYFDMEEKEAYAVVQKSGSSSQKSSIKGKKKEVLVGDKSVRSQKSGRSKKSGRSGKSKRARDKARSVRSGRSTNGHSVFSQASSILTSDSDGSYRSTDSSGDDFEMDGDLIDIEAEHQRVRLEALQMLQRAERSGGNNSKEDEHDSK